jgi:hypothetical protein
MRAEIKAALLAVRAPVSILRLAIYLDALGLVKLTRDARLYRDHPLRQEIAGHVKALYDAGELAGMDAAA